jgi:hypothetical protein
MTTFLSLILCSLFISTARAQWPSSVLKRVEEATEKAHNLNTPGLGSFWGGFRRYLAFTHNDGEKVALKSPLFKAGAVDIYVSEKPGKAPLYVFMPGIFGEPWRGLTPGMIDTLEALGGHVLVVPNLLSGPYIGAHPLYGEDPIALEIQVMEHALTYMQERLPERITRIHVIAESLGTAVGSAWAAYDRTHLKRISDLTLLWPQLQLPVAMKNFDKIIDEHRPAAKECGSLYKLWIMASDFVFSEYPGPISSEANACLGAVVLVDGFVNSVKRSWQAHKEVTGKTGDDPQGFEEFFRRYRPEFWHLLETKSERLNLSNWMKTLRADPSFPIRIMTSQDDFLNFNLSWPQFAQEFGFKENELIIFSWGGHSGPIGMPGFREVLKETLTVP